MTYANSADLDQIAPKGAIWSESTLFAIPLYFQKQLHKKQNLGQNIWKKVFEILGNLLYALFCLSVPPSYRVYLPCLP